MVRGDESRRRGGRDADLRSRLARRRYFPLENADGAAPAVIVSPGGGYAMLSWEKEGTDVAKAFNERGFAAFVLKYRQSRISLACPRRRCGRGVAADSATTARRYRVPARPDDPSKPHWWAPLQDAQRALSVVRANATALGVDPSRLGFGGFSAGGHLTAHVSTAFDHRAYRGPSGTRRADVPF